MNWKEAIQVINEHPKVPVGDVGYYLSEYANQYGVNTTKSQAAFLANFLHETDNLNSLEEYASGEAYEGRTDLGNIYQGDGKKFKGRGGFMTTGRSNYAAVSDHIFGDDRLLDSPEILELPKFAVISSLYYWKSHGLSQLANSGNYKEIVKRINGGYNGLADRNYKLEKLMNAMSIDPIGGGAIRTILSIALVIAITYFVIKYS